MKIPSNILTAKPGCRKAEEAVGCVKLYIIMIQAFLPRVLMAGIKKLSLGYGGFVKVREPLTVQDLFIPLVAVVVHTQDCRIFKSDKHLFVVNNNSLDA